MYIVRKV